MPASTSSTAPTSTTRASPRRSSAAWRKAIATTSCSPPSASARRATTSTRAAARAATSCAPSSASLKRLQTDRIDVLFLHKFDTLTPIEEMMRGLEDVVRSGKVLYPAVSNWSAWQTQRAVDIQERHNWARLQVIQPMYNLVKRQAEVEILPMAAGQRHRRHSLQPGAAGLLSGKYLGQATGRLKTNKMYEARYGEAWTFEVAEKYVAFCKQKGLHPVSAAIAWVGSHPGDHRAHHRRAQPRPAQGFAGRGEDRHDARAARRDRRALAHAAAGHRPAGGAEASSRLRASAILKTATARTPPARRRCSALRCMRRPDARSHCRETLALCVATWTLG